MKCDVHGVEGCEAKCCKVWQGKKQEEDPVKNKKDEKHKKITTLIILIAILIWGVIDIIIFGVGE